MIDNIGTDSWQSGHSKLDQPYFHEYRALLTPDGGVAGAKPEFCYNRFFAQKNTRNPELFEYINGICNFARQNGATPVLKFVRSQGRLSWFRQNFPDDLHISLIRQPWAQFTSGWRCWTEEKNAYFLAAPFVTLERNLDDPDTAALVRRLNLPLLSERAPSIRRIIYWKRRAPLMRHATLYKAHFALWLLNTVKSLPASNLVLNADLPPQQIVRLFSAHIGDMIDAGPKQPPARRMAGQPARLKLSASAVQDYHGQALSALSEAPGPMARAWIHHWLQAAQEKARYEISDEPSTLNRMGGLWRRLTRQPALAETSTATPGSMR